MSKALCGCLRGDRALEQHHAMAAGAVRGPATRSTDEPAMNLGASFVMWAWAHAGVYLPHSAEMQYLTLPHISPGGAQPGDLIFFYSPISHV